MKIEFEEYLKKRKYFLLSMLIFQLPCNSAFRYFKLDNNFVAVILFYIIPGIVFLLMYRLIEKIIINNKQSKSIEG